MNPEWVTALATVFTALVIGASAVAALIQIRHLRRGNEIELIAKWTEVIESEQFQRARAFVTNEMPAILADPAQVRRLSWNPLPAELAQLRVVCNHFESIGAFVRLGSIDAKVACELWALVVLECWRGVAPVAALVRVRYKTDAVWDKFEYLAVLSEQYLAANPEGTYPANVSRMPVDDSLVHALEAADRDG